MRMAERNKRDLWLSKPELVELTDEDGVGTAEYVSKWSAPVHLRANVSAPSGDATSSPFGESIDYDLSVVIGDNDLSISEGDVMWALSEPQTADDGQPVMTDAYDVRAVSQSLDFFSIALKRREVR